ncbi:DUF58 domain-containing protein [Phycisphaera mikurensis]|uniref:DUF58 domain-containing protein n=1 Tax=Phycisphaera mikurensis (strain NBRC 102666 / KCTC 22515 / FYK2301M01) TaxID=1142394 RepID=I0IAW8_PHYMF|nr:DUF58 domain-containing protein [Phycisphaera mikurensis]MBB6442620.1 uncharacterized protein (DUF58 family) [Phycisphaera mikurensis]BAM02406.1 hypothetical protein PSMK_02470 [Phycisphaera mikurensis NBRC 102666]
MTLLSPAERSRLDALDLASRKLLRGGLQGERRAKQKGQSVEFADFRPYTVGDDLRRIDWNLYARLDKLILRLFLEEQDLALTVLIDVSPSMAEGQPSGTDPPEKLLAAKRIAAALGYLALSRMNRLAVHGFHDGLTDGISGLRGRRPIPRLLAFLEGLRSAEGPGDLGRSLFDLARRHPRAGVVLVISDLLDKPSGGRLEEALKPLAAQRFDAHVLHLLSPAELDPASAGITGDLRLTDREDGDAAEVSATPQLLRRYRQTLDAFCAGARSACLRRGVSYGRVSSADPLESGVLPVLRAGGLVRA